MLLISCIIWLVFLMQCSINHYSVAQRKPLHVVLFVVKLPCTCMHPMLQCYSSTTYFICTRTSYKHNVIMKPLSVPPVFWQCTNKGGRVYETSHLSNLYLLGSLVHIKYGIAVCRPVHHESVGITFDNTLKLSLRPFTVDTVR